MFNLGVQFLDLSQSILGKVIIVIFITDSDIKFLNIFIDLIPQWLFQFLNIILIFELNI